MHLLFHDYSFIPISDGRQAEFEQHPTAEAMSNWLAEMMKPAVIYIENETEIIHLTQSQDVVVIGYFSSNASKGFSKHTPIFITSSFNRASCLYQYSNSVPR